MSAMIQNGLKIEDYTPSDKKFLRKRFPHLEIRQCENGLGVFSTILIPEGTYIGRVEGPYILDTTYGSPYCMTVSPFGVMEPDPPLRYVNHSCDPNCAIISVPAKDAFGRDALSEVWFQAVKDIPLGFQLSIDYAWEDEAVIVPCRCGSAKCRGFVASERAANKLKGKKETSRNARTIKNTR